MAAFVRYFQIHKKNRMLSKQQNPNALVYIQNNRKILFRFEKIHKSSTKSNHLILDEFQTR
uniref:Uncharacterized protein n=1 Tax=Arundo donax TaxID=35708 RepID=A0A0A8Z3T4_ARUDO